MKIRTVVIGLAVAALGGLVLMDYYSDDSKRARELSEIQKLAPDVQPPDCFPKAPNAKLLAAAIKGDQRGKETLQDDAIRRGAIKHDCIRGADSIANVQRLAKALGQDGVKLYAEVLEKCPVVKDEYPVYPCFALDALTANGSKEAVAAMEKALTNHDKARRNVYEGALYRLMVTPGWKTTAELAELLIPEQEWEAKLLLLEQIRSRREAAARASLEKAYAAEKDDQAKGYIKAALLELDNAGKCVVENEAGNSEGLCNYTCRDENVRFKYPKKGNLCELVVPLPPPDQRNPTAPPVTTATPVPSTANNSK
jgi:hypothetical protein